MRLLRSVKLKSVLTAIGLCYLLFLGLMMLLLGTLEPLIISLGPWVLLLGWVPLLWVYFKRGRKGDAAWLWTLVFLALMPGIFYGGEWLFRSFLQQPWSGWHALIIIAGIFLLCPAIYSYIICTSLSFWIEEPPDLLGTSLPEYLLTHYCMLVVLGIAWGLGYYAAKKGLFPKKQNEPPPKTEDEAA